MKWFEDPVLHMLFCFIMGFVVMGGICEVTSVFGPFTIPFPEPENTIQESTSFYPSGDYINPDVSSWTFITKSYSNHTNYTVYRLDEHGSKQYQIEKVLDGILYNVTFVGLDSDLDEVIWIVNKTCFVPGDIQDDVTLLWYPIGFISSKHRVYYQEVTDDLWQIDGVFDFVVGFENGVYD